MPFYWCFLFFMVHIHLHVYIYIWYYNSNPLLCSWCTLFIWHHFSLYSVWTWFIVSVPFRLIFHPMHVPNSYSAQNNQTQLSTDNNGVSVKIVTWFCQNKCYNTFTWYSHTCTQTHLSTSRRHNEKLGLFSYSCRCSSGWEYIFRNRYASGTLWILNLRNKIEVTLFFLFCNFSFEDTFTTYIGIYNPA